MKILGWCCVIGAVVLVIVGAMEGQVTSSRSGAVYFRMFIALPYFGGALAATIFGIIFLWMGFTTDKLMILMQAVQKLSANAAPSKQPESSQKEAEPTEVPPQQPEVAPQA